MIKFLFSAVKRRFNFSKITDSIKQKIIDKNSMQIWSGEQFTEEFIMYYILYNSDQKLRV